MPRTRLHRRLRLLATTSALALAVTALPIAMPASDGTPFLSAAHADSCCFSGDTLVLLANGRSCPIAKVAVGALVMGLDGRANRVLRVETPRLGRRKLYAFDGGRPFVTSEHPFLTKQGWKSIDPRAAGRERWTLELTQLHAGDRVARGRVMVGFPIVEGNVVYAAQPQVELEFQAITSIEAVESDPEQTVYNLILDGDHTYFADRYLVHNKNPGSGQGGTNGNGQGNGQGNGGSSGGGSSGGGSSGGGPSGGGSSGGGSSGGGSSGGSGSSGGGSSGGGSNSAGGQNAGDPGNDEVESSIPDATAASVGVDAPEPEDAETAIGDDAPPEDPQSVPTDISLPDNAPGRYFIFGGERPDPAALEQVGPDLTPEQERALIESGWE